MPPSDAVATARESKAIRDLLAVARSPEAIHDLSRNELMVLCRRRWAVSRMSGKAILYISMTPSLAGCGCLERSTGCAARSRQHELYNLSLEVIAHAPVVSRSSALDRLTSATADARAGCSGRRVGGVGVLELPVYGENSQFIRVVGR